MPSRHERALEIIPRLYAELQAILGTAVQIALHQSFAAVAMVNELELLGYEVMMDCNYIVRATPMELVFEQSLNDADRRFLVEPLPPDVNRA